MSKSEVYNSNKRRIFFVLILLVLLWGGILSRLLWIQILDVKKFSKHEVNLIEEAVSQRKQEVVLHTGRGDIKDRNGKPLTGSEVVGVAVFPLVRGYVDEEKVASMANRLDIDKDELLHFIREVKEPTFVRNREGKIISLYDQDAEAVDQLRLPGILALPITERYQTDGVAAQLIGYISQNPEYIEKEYAEELKNGELTRKSLIGASGLERSFDRFLQGVGPTSVSYFVDGKGNPLNGLEARLIQQDNPFYPLSLITTIDHELQGEAEKWLAEEGIDTGTAVILDAQTREILAMASRPGFHPSKMDVAQGNWVNHAIKQTVPGSVFKTAIAAAVLEEGIVKPDEEFVCEGHYGKYGFSCWKEGGHGVLTFEEAFAQSCNIAFAKAILRISPEKLEDYAEKLGLTQPVGWREAPFFKIKSFQQLSGEDKGQIFSKGTAKNDEGVLIQTAIGQRDVQITPLQAANMIATIVNDGEKQEVRVVKEIRYRTGSLFYSFDEADLPGEKLDRYTAFQLRRMLELVVQNGTAKVLQDAKWKLAGKTGTAQTPVSGKNNQWFIGYGPADHPQYVVAVVAEQVDSSSRNKVLPVVKKIMDHLAFQEEQAKNLIEYNN